MNQGEVPIGRRPYPTTRHFDQETDPAVIDQLVRAEFVCERGLVAGKDILDVGCGTGYTARFFVERGCASSVTGLEVDAGLVARLQQVNDDPRIRYVSYEPPIFPFADTFFDVVTCFQVVEHVRKKDHGELANQTARVVKPDGLVVLSTPNRPVRSPDGISCNPDHISELDEGELRRLLEPYFRDVAFFGQRTTERRKVISRKKIHVFSHSPLGMLLRRIGVPRLLKWWRGLRKGPSFDVAKHKYTIGPEVDDVTLTLIALSRGPTPRKY